MIDTLDLEATLFVHVLDGQYFKDIFDTLHIELLTTDPAQANLLVELRIRFGAIRDKLRLELEKKQRDAAQAEPVLAPAAQEAPDGDHHPN